MAAIGLGPVAIDIRQVVLYNIAEANTVEPEEL